MGCAFNTAYYPASQPETRPAHTGQTGQPDPAPPAVKAKCQSGSPVCYPVPFGHIPYTPSLPDAMGPLWDFPIEWWYYAGWATDETGNKKFTVLLEILRCTLLSDKTLTGAAILYGIGTDSASFVTNSVMGNGDFPPATSTAWSVGFKAFDFLDEASMTCKMTSNGVLGLAGASYQLEMVDKEKSVAASFTMEDHLGMVLEGGSGAFHKTGGANSFEFAMPSLSITSGSITLSGKTTKIGSGNLWLDRQTETLSILDPDWQNLKYPPASHPRSKPLYTGNWLAINMNDHTVYNLVFFWPRKTEQWKVGSELQPPVYPKSKIGLEYPSLPNWQGESHPPVSGVVVLGQDEFDLNILEPGDPNSSPHWNSKPSQPTYCTAWRLMIKGKVYNMTALVPGSQVKQGKYFFEGAASICNISDGTEVGHAFIEQMGYN